MKKQMFWETWIDLSMGSECWRPVSLTLSHHPRRFASTFSLPQVTLTLLYYSGLYIGTDVPALPHPRASKRLQSALAASKMIGEDDEEAMDVFQAALNTSDLRPKIHAVIQAMGGAEALAEEVKLNIQVFWGNWLPSILTLL